MSVYREARRHNALIRTNSLDEPLRPLLRPPPPGEDAVPLDELELMTPSDDGRATPLRGLDTSALPPALTIDARLRSKSKSGIRGKHLLKEPATPSPLFPRDLSSLMNLSPHETKALIKDYGLARLRHVARTPVTQSGEPNDIFSPSYNTNAGTVGTEVVEEDEPREESLNRFLSYIGVRHSSVILRGFAEPFTTTGELQARVPDSRRKRSRDLKSFEHGVDTRDVRFPFHLLFEYIWTLCCS